VTEDTSSDEEDAGLVGIQFPPRPVSKSTCDTVGQEGNTDEVHDEVVHNEYNTDEEENAVYDEYETVEREIHQEVNIQNGNHAAEDEVQEEVGVPGRNKGVHDTEGTGRDQMIRRDSDDCAYDGDNPENLSDCKEDDDRAGENKLVETTVQRSSRVSKTPSTFMYYKGGGDPIVTQHNNDSDVNAHIDVVRQIDQRVRPIPAPRLSKRNWGDQQFMLQISLLRQEIRRLSALLSVVV
jgi:hypothetical protein